MKTSRAILLSVCCLQVAAAEPWANVVLNLTTDLGEATNPAAQQPEKLNALSAQHDASRRATGAIIPVANPAWGKPEDKK